MRSLTLIERVGFVNVDPVVALPSGGLSYTENDPATPIDAAASLVDPDSPDFDGGVLRADLGGTGTADDRLAIRHVGTAAGEIGVSGNTVTYGGVDIGTFFGGSDGSLPLVVFLNANASLPAVEELLQNVTYENVSDAPSTLPRTVRFTVTGRRRRHEQRGDDHDHDNG